MSYCGCWYQVSGPHSRSEHLPQVDVNSHTTILSTTSRTSLKQTFINPSSSDTIEEAKYTFPLYDGVSVVAFTCHIGDRVIRGVVKEKQEARAQYKAAVEKGESAGLMEQLQEASDVFTTRLGNIPADGKVVVEITYLGELQHDAQVDAVRFMIPTRVASRYGAVANHDSWMSKTAHAVARDGVVSISVDVEVDKGSTVQQLESPTDSILVLLGRTSTMSEDVFEPNCASASLSLSANAATRPHGRDFTLLMKSKEQGNPRAFLETHPTISNQKAVMASLIPKFSLPNISPEMVLVIDQSGSMKGKIPTLKTALNLFLKSLPVGVKFNLCSFGSRFNFLWDKSQTFDEGTFSEASTYISNIEASFGGTEMYSPIEETVKRRYKDLDLEILLLTDGQIWDQEKLFGLINSSTSENTVRVFSLGIGHEASQSLIQGVARAGKGFAQAVGEDEQMDKKVVRMLRGALTPHISDYRVEIEYANDNSEGESEYEMVDGSSASTVTVESTPVLDTSGKDIEEETETDKGEQTPISLFDESYKEPKIETFGSGSTGSDRFKDLPLLNPPKKLQAPYKMPHLFPFSRISVYVLLSEEMSQRTPKALVIRGTSKHGPLVLNIPVQDIGQGETIHQLAARKLGTELEEGRGWIFDVKDKTGKLMKDSHESKWDLIVAREAVRIGLKFQVASKWCSFVAVENNESTSQEDNSGEQLQRVLSDVGSSTGIKEQAYRPRYCASRSFGVATAGSAPTSRAGFSAGPPSGRVTTFGGGSATSGGARSAASAFRGPAPALPDLEFCSLGASSTPSNSPAVDLRLTDSDRSKFRSLFGGLGGDNKKKRAWAEPRAPPLNVSTDSAELDDDNSEDELGAAVIDSCAEDNSEDDLVVTANDFSPEDNSEDRIHRIISHQTFNGSWDSNDKVFSLVGISEEDLDKKIPWSAIVEEAGGNTISSMKSVVIATLAVIAYFRTKEKGEEDIWGLVVDKAEGWVKERLDQLERDGVAKRKFTSDSELIKFVSESLFVGWE